MKTLYQGNTNVSCPVQNRHGFLYILWTIVFCLMITEHICVRRSFRLWHRIRRRRLRRRHRCGCCFRRGPGRRRLLRRRHRCGCCFRRGPRRCHHRTMVQNREKHRTNSYLIIHFPMSEEVSEVSERASE